MSEKELVEAAVVDPELCEVKKCIRLGWLAPDMVSAELKPYYAERGVVGVHGCCSQWHDSHSYVSFRNRVVKLAHEGHPGVNLAFIWI